MERIILNLKKSKKEYIIMLVITMFFISFFSVNRYALDTYYLEANGFFTNAIEPYFRDGRLIMTAFLYLFGVFNLSFSFEKIVSFLLAFICLFFSEKIIYDILEKYSKNKVILILGSMSTILSIFTIEYFMFPEYTGVMCLSILSAFLSVSFLLKFYDKNCFKYIFLSIIFSVITALSYQGVLSLVLIIPVLFIYKYSENLKKIILNFFYTLVVYFVPCIITLLISKVTHASRIASKINIFESLKKIFESLSNVILNTDFILPKYLYLLFFSIILIIIVIRIISSKKIKYLFYIFFILIIDFFATIAPYVFVEESKISIVGRSAYGFGLLISIPILFYIIYFSNNKMDKDKYGVVLCLIISIFMVIEYCGWLSLFCSQIKSDTLDNYETQIYGEKILKYEKEKNIKIISAYLYFDEHPTYVYNGVKQSSDINLRVFSTSWAALPKLSIYLKQNIIDAKENINAKNYCSSKDWQFVNEDQLYFVNNSVYICSY